MMGLRVKEGLDIERYRMISGKPLDAKILCDLANDGLIVKCHNRLILTETGRMILNAIVVALMPND